MLCDPSLQSFRKAGVASAGMAFSVLTESESLAILIVPDRKKHTAMTAGGGIRFFRNLPGMTQKHPEQTAGFPEKTADIRTVQGESGLSPRDGAEGKPFRCCRVARLLLCPCRTLTAASV